MKSYYKVIVLAISALETAIADERHFATIEEATAYSSRVENQGYIGVIVQMGE